MSNLIDRSALGIGYADPNCFDDPKYAYGWNSAISIINAAPTVDAEPVRHGQWEKITYQNSRGELWQGRTCNRCVEAGFERGYVLAIGEPNQNYCPNCGAKMNLEENGK